MYAVFSFYWAVWVVFLYEITFGLRPPLSDFSIDFLGKFGEEIEKNLIDQQLSSFRGYFQFFGVHSSLRWRRSRLAAADLHALSLPKVTS